MKAITILQPFPALIVLGQKRYETRGWKTSYRGPIAIHAGKGLRYIKLAFQEPFKTALQPIQVNGGYNAESFNLGYVIAIVDLVDCYYIVYHPGTNIDVAKNIKIGAESMALDKRDPDFGKYIVPTEQELAFGDWTPGRYAWKLENVRRIEPVPAKGMQRLWEWEEVRHL